MAQTAALEVTPVISIDSDDDDHDDDDDMMITSTNIPKKSSYKSWLRNSRTNDEDDIIFLDAALPSAASGSSVGANSGPLDLSMSTVKSSPAQLSLSDSSDDDIDTDEDETSSESGGAGSGGYSTVREPGSLLSQQSWENILGPSGNDTLDTWVPLFGDRDQDTNKSTQERKPSPVMTNELGHTECMPNPPAEKDAIDLPDTKPRMAFLECSSDAAPAGDLCPGPNPVADGSTATDAHLCGTSVDPRTVSPVPSDDKRSGAILSTDSESECEQTFPKRCDEQNDNSDVSDDVVDDDNDDEDDTDEDDDNTTNSDSDDTMLKAPKKRRVKFEKSKLKKRDWGSGSCVFTANASTSKQPSEGQSTASSVSHQSSRESSPEGSTSTSKFSIDHLLGQPGRNPPSHYQSPYAASTPPSSSCDEDSDAGHDQVGCVAPLCEPADSTTTTTTMPQLSPVRLNPVPTCSKERRRRSSGTNDGSEEEYRGDLIVKIKTKHTYAMDIVRKRKMKKRRKSKLEPKRFSSCAKQAPAPSTYDSDSCVTVLDSDDEDNDDIIFIKRTRKRDKTVDKPSTSSSSAAAASTSSTSSSSNLFSSCSSTSSTDWFNFGTSSLLDPMPFNFTKPLSTLHQWLPSSSSSHDSGDQPPPPKTTASDSNSSSGSGSSSGGAAPTSKPTTSTSSASVSKDDSGDGIPDMKPHLKRSVSCMGSSSKCKPPSSSCTIPFKKRHFSASGERTSPQRPSTSASGGSTRPKSGGSCTESNKPPVNGYSCYSCGNGLGESGSSCLEGHRCCDMCLQARVKHILGKSRKGSLRCGVSGCSSYYTLSELRRSLPPMVVDILEDKLDTEYMDFATHWALRDVEGEVISSDSEVEVPSASGKDQEAAAAPVVPPVKEKTALSLPDHWVPMLEDQDYQTVKLDPASAEYDDLSRMFHRTMLTPRAHIISMKRVQNPILWQFYQVKKMQMSKEHCGNVKEMQLFHGTKKSVADAICRSNFDWRLSGTNGTMYGQGSYFAQDANYSHKFTDLQPRCAHSRLSVNSLITSLMSARPLNLAPLPPFMSYTNIPVPSLSNAGFNIQPSTSMALTGAWNSLGGDSSATTTPTATPVAAEEVYNVPIPGWQSEAVDNPAIGHTHVMFVARVLVGLYTQGRQCMRKPPALDHRNPYGRCYDSCVNDLCDPRIYVIFDSAQCFPEYIIEFQNRLPSFMS